MNSIPHLMNYFGGKKKMHDERILKELNQSKLRVLYYIFIVALISFILKAIVFKFSAFTIYTVEIFILLLASIILIIRYFMYRDPVDERIEIKYEKVGNIFFSILFFGGFFIHYFNIVFSTNNSLPATSLISTVLLIGFIILVYQLKKRDIHFHYRILNLPKWAYYRKIFKRIGIFTLIFSINLLPFIIYKENLLAAAIVIGFSYIGLVIEYLVFSIYERNHYLEKELKFDGKYRSLSKNVIVFYSIILLYNVFILIINYIYQNAILYDLYDSDIRLIIEAIRLIAIIYRIDIIIIATILGFIIRNSIKIQFGKNIIYKLMTAYIFSSLIIGIIVYLWSITSPLILRLIFYNNNNFDFISNILNTSGLIQLILIVIPYLILIAITIFLYKAFVFDLYFLVLHLIALPIGMALMRFSFAGEGRFLLILSIIVQIISYIFLYLFFYQKSEFIDDLKLEQT